MFHQGFATFCCIILPFACRFLDIFQEDPVRVLVLWRFRAWKLATLSLEPWPKLRFLACACQRWLLRAQQTTSSMLCPQVAREFECIWPRVLLFAPYPAMLILIGRLVVLQTVTDNRWIVAVSHNSSVPLPSAIFLNMGHIQFVAWVK